jgi:nitrogen-specific signal transduction histidine kinase
VGDTGAGVSAGGIVEFLTKPDQANGQTWPTEANLGLALVTVVIEAHGGRVERQSQPGLGSHITLSLPILSHAVEDLDRSMPVWAKQDGRYAYTSRL